MLIFAVAVTGCTIQPEAGGMTGSQLNYSDNYGNTAMLQTPMPSNSGKADKYSQAPGILSDDQIKGKKSILTTEKGVIEIELFSDEAPIAVSNHVFLVNDKFYDDLTFHRREEGFVIQGGDPLGKGYGGPGYRFEDEPVMREYDRGIVAMANAGPDTNGSQFFIMLANVPLPPNYTIFGKVIAGIEVIDQIKVGDKIIKAEIVNL